MSKFLKVSLVFAAFLTAFVVLPMMALQASSTVSQPVIVAAAPQPLAPNAVVSITIMHTNDFHGQLEASGSNPGYARDVAVINQVRTGLNSANVLLLDAGDEMQGSLLSNLNKGASVIDLFSLAGVKAATFG